MKTPFDALDAGQRSSISKFIKEHPVAVLATVTPDGSPHASPLYIGLDENHQIIFTTKSDTQKAVNLAHRDQVMIASYDAASQTSLQLTGQATLVDDPSEVQKIYQTTLQAADQTGMDNVPPVAKIVAGSFVAYRVTVDNIWLNNYGWGDSYANAVEQADKPHEGGDPA